MKKNYATSTSFFNLVKMPLMLAFMLLMLAFAQVAYSQETVSTVPVWDGNQKVNICVGGTVSVSVANSTSGHNYRLRSTDPAYTYTEIVTSTGGTLTFTLLTFNATDAGILFNVRDISDPSGYEVPDDNFEVIVVADPIAPTMIKNPNVASVCEGEEVDATDVSAGSGGAGCSDSKWYRTETNNTTWSSWQSYTPGNNISTVGKTGVEVKAERSPSSENGCYAENIYAWDVTKVTATASNDGPACVGETVNLTGGGGPASISTWSWTGPNSFSSNLQNPSITNVTTAASGTYTLTVTDVNGCTDTAKTIVVVNTLPAAPTAGNYSGTYDALAHTGTATPPSGSSVVWYDASSGGNVSAAPSSTDVGTFTAYAESVDDLTGCKSATRTQVTVTITKADLAVTAVAGNITYGDPAPAVTVNYSGFQGSESSAVLDNTGFILGTDYTQYNNVGTYNTTILIGTATDNNYNLTPLNTSTFSVGKANLAVTAVAGNIAYGDPAPAVTVNYSGFLGTDDTDDLDNVRFHSWHKLHTIRSCRHL
jgi:hypothetical protein